MDSFRKIIKEAVDKCLLAPVEKDITAHVGKIIAALEMNKFLVLRSWEKVLLEEEKNES